MAIGLDSSPTHNLVTLPPTSSKPGSQEYVAALTNSIGEICSTEKVITPLLNSSRSGQIWAVKMES